jgi:hypothetical protein
MKIIGIFIFIISSVGLFGQKQQFDRATYYTFGVNLFAESHTLPSESKDSVEVLVLFKVVYEALIFVQMNPLDNPGSFQALPSVEIFFRDASGIIKNRTLWSDSIWVNTYNETKAKDKYVEGYIITKLPLSEFKCTVQLLDRYKNIADKTEITINTKKNFIENEIISEPIFCYSTSSLPAYKSIPYILGNKINFTSKDSKLLIPVSFKKNYDVYNYVITKNIDKNDQFWNDPINISGRVQPSENTYLNLEKNNKNEIEISLK